MLFSHADPVTYAVDAFRSAIYAPDEPARLLVQFPFALDLGVLLVAGAVLAVAAARSFEKQS